MPWVGKLVQVLSYDHFWVDHVQLGLGLHVGAVQKELGEAVNTVIQLMWIVGEGTREEILGGKERMKLGYSAGRQSNVPRYLNYACLINGKKEKRS